MTSNWLPTLLFTGAAVLSAGRTAQAGALTLAWTPNAEADVAGYVVSYGTAPRTYSATLDVGNNASPLLTDLTSGATYYFVVKAYNTAGMASGDSVEIAGVVPGTTAPGTTTMGGTPPTTPAGLTATATSTTQVGLAWMASSASAGTPGYLVERCAWAGCADFTQVGTSAGATFADAALLAGTSYSYRVRAVDADNSLSGYSNIATVATQGGNSTLVAAYAFDEGAGTTAGDASTAGNTGTVIDAAWTASGKHGGALAFDGYTAARVNVPDAASLHLTNAMTLELWVNPSAPPADGSWQPLLYKGLDTYLLATLNGGVPVAGATASGTTTVAYGTALLPLNTWTHLATTFDGATMTLYVNGVLTASVAVSGPLADSTEPLELGGSLADGALFAGLLDDVRVYASVLTPEQIQTDMNTPVASR